MNVGYIAEAFEITFDFYVESKDTGLVGLRYIGELFDGAVGIATTSILMIIDIDPETDTGLIGYFTSVDVEVAPIEVGKWYRTKITFTGVEAGATFDMSVYEADGYEDEGTLVGSVTGVGVRSAQTSDVNQFAVRDSGSGNLSVVHFDNFDVVTV
jgi:hypothetical protein